jgi:flagellar assembly factor FliW
MTTLQFTAPLLGLGDEVEFALTQVDDVPGLYRLAGEHVQLHVIDPDAFLEDYSPAVDAAELRRIGEVEDPAAYAMFVVTRLDAGAPSANLMAPIIVHRGTGRAAQVILADDRYPVAAPLAA